MQTGDVYVVMNSLDSHLFLEEALGSAAAQTVLPREVIFFENGLSNQTEQIINAHPWLILDSSATRRDYHSMRHESRP
jgi:hypothetical protein